MKSELNIFFNALLYFTRCRVPKSVMCNEQSLSASFRYFPLVGMLMALLSVGLYLCVNAILPREIAIVAVMVFSILMTGGFHEDGLADFFDGFGGGHDKEGILRIMKDSHIGTYGVIALILAFLLKFQVLLLLPEQLMLPALVVMGAISRFYPVLVVRISHYARKEQSKAAHCQLGVSPYNVWIAALTSIPPLFLFGWLPALILLAVGLIFTLLLHLYMKRWLGGYTGDCLGALQQMSELLFLTSLLALLPLL